jgi:hypothetical protein
MLFVFCTKSSLLHECLDRLMYDYETPPAYRVLVSSHVYSSDVHAMPPNFQSSCVDVVYISFNSVCLEC